MKYRVLVKGRFSPIHQLQNSHHANSYRMFRLDVPPQLRERCCSQHLSLPYQQCRNLRCKQHLAASPIPLVPGRCAWLPDARQATIFDLNHHARQVLITVHMLSIPSYNVTAFLSSSGERVCRWPDTATISRDCIWRQLDHSAGLCEFRVPSERNMLSKKRSDVHQSLARNAAESTGHGRSSLNLWQ